MPGSLSRISAQSAPDQRAPLAVVTRATASDRALAFTFLGLGVPWLVYTRLYFFLHERHLTFDGGLLMRYTNKPDPFCGGTPAFAWVGGGGNGDPRAGFSLGP